MKKKMFNHTMEVNKTVWLPTFFKISSFVFHRRKKKHWNVEFWNDM